MASAGKIGDVFGFTTGAEISGDVGEAND